MKKTFFNKTIPVLIVYFFSVIILQAQSNNSYLKEGDPVPQWLINEQATYNEVKQKFIDHYGEDKENWPVFIQESEKLFEQFQEFNSKQKNPHHPKYSKFFNNELKLGHDETKSLSYRESHANSYRNYAIVTEYITILYTYGSNSWTVIEHEGSPKLKSYLNVDSTDGILPLILYTYVSKFSYGKKNTSICPIGMLDWYFEDIFPVIDLLYQQDELSELVKTLKSIQVHIKKLIDNHDFVKAEIWTKSTQEFIRFYHFNHLKPKLSDEFYEHHLWNNFKYIEEKQKEAIEQFNTVFSNNLANNLGGLSFTLNYYGNEYWSPKNTTVGELVFDTDGSNLIILNKEFIKEYEEHNSEYLGHSYKVEGNFHEVTKGINIIPFTDIFNYSEVLIDNGNSIIFYGIDDSVHGNNINDKGHFIVGEQGYLFAISERCTNGLNYAYKIPPLTYFGLTPYSVTWVHNFPFEEKVTHRIQQLITYAFIKTVDEVLNNVTVVPQIHGMKYKRKRRTRVAIAATSTPREVKTDGKSTTEIIATLFEYTPGTDLPSVPVAGKNISFSINEQYGITPGIINTSTVVTNINGQAKIIFTSPTGEALQQSDKLINAATVNVVCNELNVEELAYVSFASDKGKVRVDPPFMGFISNEGIVPPDSRFPALITVNLEDDRLQPMPNTKVDVKIVSDKPLGKIRSDNGQEGISLNLVSDSRGDLEFQYFYAAENPPDKPITEVIEIKTSEMAVPLRAYVTIGLNLVFEVVENAYEGKGIVNAGEKIPLRIRIKDIWYPEIDLAPILTYWGTDDKAGNTSLDVKLEIEKISTVPKYLVDQIKLENYPEEPFIHNMNVRSFKDKKVYNMLWLPGYSLEDYKGYPRITPTTVGNHYYEAKVTLIDSNGEEVFSSNHPSRKALFNIQTGLAADEMQIFFISNPFKPQTREGKLLATALDVMGFGAILSVTNALYMINNGDTEGLYNALFSEVKGVIIKKVGDRSAYNELAVDLYSGMALAEKVGFEIMKDQTGTLSQMEESIFKSLYTSFDWKKGQIVILYGDGNQVLMEDKEESTEEKELNKVKSVFNLNDPISNNSGNDNPDKLLAAIENNKNVIPAIENKYIRDENRSTASIKSGNISVYIIPANMKVQAKNGVLKRY